MRLPAFRPKRSATLVVCALIVAYAVFFSYLSIRRHLSLHSQAYDLGIFDQVLWNTAHGRPFLNSVMADSPFALGDHWEPLYAILSPLYWLWSDVRILLIAQAVFLALGAVPLYWLARERAGDAVGVALVVAYVLFPPLQAGNMYDFHPVVLAVPLLALAIKFLLDRNYPAMVICALLAMQVKENVPLLSAMLGLYAAFVQRRWKIGLTWTAFCLVFFFLLVSVVIPAAHQSTGHHNLTLYSDLGASPAQIVWTLVSNPTLAVKLLSPAFTVQYLRDVLAPFGFLGALAPFELLLSLPELALNFLSNFPPMHRLALQYPFLLLPAVAMGSVIGAERAIKWLGSRRVPAQWAQGVVVILVLGGALIEQRAYGLTPLGLSYPRYPVTAHERLLAGFISQIPSDASVWAQPNLVPHLTHRERVHTLGELDADYMLFDMATLMNQDNISEWALNTALKTYHVVAAEDGFLLLQRGPGDTTLPPAFYSFAVASNPQITYPISSTFGDAIQLLGYNIDYYDWEVIDEPQLIVYFRALRKLPKDYGIRYYLIDDRGRVAGASSWPESTLVWYPTSQWKPGEIIQVRFNTISWQTRDMRHFAIALGIADSADPWDVGARLLPDGVQSPGTVVLPANGTLLQIAAFSNDLLLRRRPSPPSRLRSVPSGATQVNSTFTNSIALRGYRLVKATDQKGAPSLHVTLYWQANSAVSERYTVFVHALDADGKLIAQNDSPPNRGNTPTTVWLQGEVVADEHDIDLTGISGKATLAVGMYSSATGVRVDTRDGEDAVRLPAIHIP